MEKREMAFPKVCSVCSRPHILNQDQEVELDGGIRVASKSCVNVEPAKVTEIHTNVDPNPTPIALVPKTDKLEPSVDEFIKTAPKGFMKSLMEHFKSDTSKLEPNKDALAEQVQSEEKQTENIGGNV
jgi:hypothetical protein